ncbi:MAG: LysM peptidoglycan-binding domain-containing M23 family metallopeptidase [Candidatus Colwellbacteria bacterium]|nr:LysM peptidoglycan-binding domain-containing M23 family metallopeptidase [Candidatus Colwellbacteria bacterium]
MANQAPLPDPEFIEDDLVGNDQDGAFLGSAGPTSEISHDNVYADFGGFVLVEKNSLLGGENPLAEAVQDESELLTYKVKDGDTLSNIAANFGISVKDILSANDKGSSLIKPGEELVILPVSKSGSGSVVSDDAEIVADPDEDFFIRPVSGGWNWGEIHDSQYMPAIDISTACGAPVYAAAAGKVIKVGSPSYYNQGYGGYLIISHSNGTRTLYAHNSENLVEIGDSVEQGEQIARIGNTGMTYGSTGCHIHFGASGVSNPFAR